MKNLKLLLTLICTMTVTVAFAGCGNSFDPVAAVEAEMQLLTTGVVPEDAEDVYAEDPKTVQAEYDKEFQSAVDQIVDGMNCEAYAEGDRRTKVETFCKSIFAKCKYEVSQEYTEKDGAYLIDLTVKPVDLKSMMDKVGKDGEFYQKWKDKVSSGEYTVTSQDQLMIDLYDDLFDYLNAEVEKAGNTDAKIITLKLIDDGKGVYDISEEQKNELTNMLFVY